MLHSNYLLKKEKRRLREAIENNDTDTIYQIFQQDSIDINAYINPVCVIM